MKKKKNSKRDTFLNSLPTLSLEDKENPITTRCKFNFSYFNHNQEAACSFINLKETLKNTIANKLIAFSLESLEHWGKTGAGKKRIPYFVNYGIFPTNSDFSHPTSIPHDVEWGRFRINSNVRLIGFVCPEMLKNTKCNDIYFDLNTFYVVFIDLEHTFYKLD